MNAFFLFPYFSPFVIRPRIIRKTLIDPHVSKIDNKTNCSLDNIDNSDEEIEFPNDILEALEKQDEGSKANREELEVVNLAEEGEELKEVKIKMADEDKSKTAFITHQGTFIYDVMPFCLKNAGATFQ
jgi:hypothetical protein